MTSNFKEKTIHIFISSPGDVAVEREKARKVVEALQKRYAGRLNLETVLWEDLPLGANTSFQQGIDLVLSDQNGVDIAVFILWSRLGSPLGAAIRKPDGSEYRSGTEREFDMMLSAREQSPDDRPELLVYVRNDDQHFKSELMERKPDEIEEMIRQRKLAEQFVQEQFHDSETGTNLRAYHTFAEPVSFAERLKTHLQKLLDQLVLDEGWSAGTWEGAPYRGLEVFEAEHARIFFGREEEICEVLERLRVQARTGCAFALLVGASGSGKSSLARAGVLPSLVNGNFDESISEWRTATLIPGLCENNLCGGLARILLNTMPELRTDEDTLGEFEELLSQGQGKALSMLCKRAFSDAEKKGAVRMALLIDQLEELFTTSELSESMVETFLRAVQALASSGFIHVLATVRSDFYDRCQRSPVLMELKGSQGQVDLLPPEPSDIHRIITGPAFMAGVIFEKDENGESLDQRILNDVVGHPEALPLLEFALAQLYKARTPEGFLTLVAYEKFGGIEGAIGHQAEKVFAQMTDDAQTAIPLVLPLLVPAILILTFFCFVIV